MDQSKERDKHPLPRKEKPIEQPVPSGGNGDDAEAIESVPLYRNFKLVIPLFVLLIGIAIVVYYWYMGTREFVSTDDAFIDANRVAVSTKILGRIDTLTVDEGDTVKAGQMLVRLDDTDLRAQQAQARTSLALAQENIVLANVSLDKAETDFKRAAAQFKDNIITKEQFEHAQSELETAKARLGIAVAQTNSARAQIAVVETQIRNTVVVSPMSGVVSKRWALAGDVVSAGQPVFSLYDLKNVWVTANLEETSISVLRSADKVEISVDAYPERKFTGQVLQIGSNTASQFSLIPPNNASGNFTKVTQRVPVKISIEPIATTPASRPPELLPGMSVEVKVKVK
jgi:membrane fusion protein, multidrug efflux system